MDEPNGNSKAEKKALKAELKHAKKQAKAEAKLSTEARPASRPTPAADKVGGMSPAERSAAAAETQVRLQKLRVLIAVIAAIVAALTLLFSWKPWSN